MDLSMIRTKDLLVLIWVQTSWILGKDVASKIYLSYVKDLAAVHSNVTILSLFVVVPITYRGYLLFEVNAKFISPSVRKYIWYLPKQSKFSFNFILF